MNVKFVASLPQYMNDVPEILRAFFPYVIEDGESGSPFELNIRYDGSRFAAEILSEEYGAYSETFEISEGNGLVYKRLTKRFVKTVLYKYLSRITGVNLPYGSLTGVRPTKLFYELTEEGFDAEKYLIDNFFVSPQKAKFIKSVVEGQKGIYDTDSKSADIFVNIPFCPTRCGYCSFISTEIGRIRKKIPVYIECVKKELEDIKVAITSGGLNLRSIYVGGGTPTSLTAEELKDILSPLKGFNKEFTVEAGRPDSITREKLEVLADAGVTRISINPQTFNGETLRLIGRTHTPDDIYNAFSLAREFSFDINSDLIAALPGESAEDFRDTLEKTISLRPENITVHTLSIKRGAELRNSGTQKGVSGVAAEMTSYAAENLVAQGYMPYYMYRQKYSFDNLENAGYSLPGKQCVYNVDYMEETTTVLSAGAGAMSKFVYRDENRIERKANPKGLNDYLKKFGLV